MTEVDPFRPKYHGEKMFMDGQDWIVPPLSLHFLKNNQEKIVALREIARDPGALDLAHGQFSKFIDASLDIVHAAMVRNYPTLQRESLDSMIDLGTLPKIVVAVMRTSGLTGGPQSGETKAGSQ